MIEIVTEKNPGIPQHDHGIAMLKREIGVRAPDFTEFKLLKMNNGKPYIENINGFNFNISHSGKWTVIAISDHEVGIDIQQIKSTKANVAKRFFTRRENQKLELLSGIEHSKVFTRIWTLKEARVKASDERLAKCITEFETIEYDSTWAKKIKGYYVHAIPFPDPDYLLACSSPVEIENNYTLKVL